MSQHLLTVCKTALTCRCVTVAKLNTICGINKLASNGVLGTLHSFSTTSILPVKSFEPERKKENVRSSFMSKLDHGDQIIDEAIPKDSPAASEDAAPLVGVEDYGAIIPNLKTQDALFNGQLYKEIPVMHVLCTMNNTIIALTNAEENHVIANASCGTEGFRNVKKSSIVAAQATGQSIAIRAMKRGVKQVRVVLKGIGSGRLPAIKGMEAAGLTIVSLTDRTPIPDNGYRPRAVRRL